MRIALVGTRGVPARYGGFETCVEEVGKRLADRGHEVVVYCRSSDEDLRDEFEGMRLVHLPALRTRALETMSHTGLSAMHLVAHRADAVIMFNAANAVWLPVVRAARMPVATHVDGLEWRRAKWGTLGKNYYRLAERLAVWWSNALIADAKGIADYYRSRFGAATELISYGAPLLEGVGDHRLAELGLSRHGYHLVVARFEPENHVHVIIEGYVRSSARLPLLVVGSAPYADAYTQRLKGLADDRVQFLGGVWDQELLDQLYANSLEYLHGHSVGGTNPSLLRALGAGAAVTAFDVVFNREVALDSGRYFRGPDDVRREVEVAESDVDGAIARGAQGKQSAARYDWDAVTDEYEDLCERLAKRVTSPAADRTEERR